MNSAAYDPRLGPQIETSFKATKIDFFRLYPRFVMPEAPDIGT